MSLEPAPRFIDAGGNEYLGLAIDDALDLAGMLARLLDVIESPAVTEALEELLGSAGNLSIGDDVSRRLCGLGCLIGARPARALPAGFPSRDEPATPRCPVCEAAFVPSPNQRYCSAACRATAWRWRHAQPRPLIPKLAAPRSPKSSTIYACDACGTRSLGQQRCEECGTFMRRLGPGGHCPHCEEALAITDLVDEEVMPGLA